MVVAVDYYWGRFVYTIDDSSGQCIECALEAPSRPAPKANGTVNGQGSNHSADGHAAAALSELSGPPQSQYEVGMVVVIKGSVKIFRDQKQLKVHKIEVIRSTEEEVQFWNKISNFRNQYLAQPWKLSSEDLRKCRADYLKEERRQTRKQSKESTSEAKAARRHRSRSRERRDGKQNRTQR